MVAVEQQTSTSGQIARRAVADAVMHTEEITRAIASVADASASPARGSDELWKRVAR